MKNISIDVTSELGYPHFINQHLGQEQTNYEKRPTRAKWVLLVSTYPLPIKLTIYTVSYCVTYYRLCMSWSKLKQPKSIIFVSITQQVEFG